MALIRQVIYSSQTPEQRSVQVGLQFRLRFGSDEAVSNHTNRVRRSMNKLLHSSYDMTTAVVVRGNYHVNTPSTE